MKLSSPVNEGWLYSKDRDSIKLFASYDREEDGTLTFGDRTMISFVLREEDGKDFIGACNSFLTSF